MAILDESACQSPLGFYFRAESCLSSTKNAHQHYFWPIFQKNFKRPICLATDAGVAL